DNYKGLYRFLEYLNRAKVFHIIRAKTKGDNIFTKPEKIYLNNTNLHFAYCDTHNIGTTREVYFASMLKVSHDVAIAKKGDFLVDDKYTFEVGGKNKRFKQIKDIKNSFVVSDEIEVGSKNKIPLWLFGFLY
ncbi:MAG: hypothetical protein U9Q20_07235, partial [Campylobacterota bacterium]|nr:hypothetical protein [Campylobacterota bacterium]